MGRDKAWIPLDGTPLWKLQLRKLRAVCGDITVCGNAFQRALFESEGIPFVADAVADLGPLAGLARALESTRTSHVLVLAIDMPKMSEAYLARLCESAQEDQGVVPEIGGMYEGLCAVYPARMLPVVAGLLAGAERSLQTLNRIGIERNLMRAFPVAETELALFENWNTPADIAPLPD
jgi:molybdopterin-guanine dinucleotide biosynthesis protein A